LKFICQQEDVTVIIGKIKTIRSQSRSNDPCPL
jgi:hypothetical protein